MGGVLALTAVVILAGCARRKDLASVILISLDTVRADRLGCYGYSAAATPNLDELARQSILFTRAQAAVPLTLPSHCSLLTGRTPPAHGVHDNLAFRLQEEEWTLAEFLKERGYRTAGFVGSFVLDARFGLDQGFDHYDDRMPPRPPGRTLGDSERPADQVTQAALEWLAGQRERPIFLFVHYYDPHAPYAPPEPHASRVPSSPYDGEIAFVDACLGDLFRRLQELDLYDPSLIVLVSDHGEGLGEHDEATHGFFIYESTLRVPMLIKPPRSRQGARSDRPTGLLDVFPTILGYLGFDLPPNLQGQDLSDNPLHADTSDQPRGLYSESLTPTKFGAAPLRALTSGRWKYILTTRPELYNLEQDPNEAVNLVQVEPDRAAQLNRRLERSIQEDYAVRGAVSDTRPDAETRERLRSLGYLSGRSVSGNLEVAPGLTDAKDLIGAYETFQKVMELSNASRFEEARGLCLDLQRTHPRVTDAVLLAGDVEFQAGAMEEAAEHYREYLRRAEAETTGELAPDLAHARFNLGNALAAMGEREEALNAYRELLRAESGHAEAAFNLGITLAELGRISEAADVFTALVEQEPDHVEARVNLARTHLVQRRWQEARRLLEEAMALDPTHPEALTESARLLLGEGRTSDGLERYRQAATQNPERTDIVTEMAWVLATHPDSKVRDGEESIRLMEPLVERSRARDPMILETLAAAWAEVGRFDRAAGLQKRAVDLLSGAPSSALEGARARLELYRRGEPFHGSR